MRRAISRASLDRAADELARDGEDADTIADTLRGAYPLASLADITRAADQAIAARDRTRRPILGAALASATLLVVRD